MFQKEGTDGYFFISKNFYRTFHTAESQNEKLDEEETIMKKMNRVASAVMAVAMAFSLAGCSGGAMSEVSGSSASAETESKTSES